MKKGGQSFFSQPHVRVASIAFGILLLAVGVFWISLRTWRTPGVPHRPEYRRGDIVADPLTSTGVLPIAVMVENSVDARPLSGLRDAHTIFETVAEGGITRFLAVYATSTPLRQPKADYGGQAGQQIGPVRSARSYYVDWASMFGGVYGHVGGSPAALDQLTHATVSDRNEFTFGNLYARITTRLAPHNTYTTFAALRDSVATSTAPLVRITPWLFQVPTSTPTSSLHLAINFSRPSYLVEWKWEPSLLGFVRSVGGATQGEFGAPYVAQNIAVAWTDMTVLDDVGRMSVRTTGQGKALLLTNGSAAWGTWKRDANKRLHFYQTDGTEKVWTNGQTWVEVVSTDMPVTLTPALAGGSGESATPVVNP